MARRGDGEPGVTDLLGSKLFLLYVRDPPARRKADALGLQGMMAKHIKGWVAEATQLPRPMRKKGLASFYRGEHQTTEKGIFLVPGPPKHPGCSARTLAVAAPCSQPLRARRRLGMPALH